MLNQEEDGTREKVAEEQMRTERRKRERLRCHYKSEGIFISITADWLLMTRTHVDTRQA